MNALTSDQKRFLIGLAIANAILFIAAGALLATPEPQASPIAAPSSPTPDRSQTCQAIAAQRMAAHAIAGTVTLHADGSIAFKLSGDDATDAWDAFAVSAELPARRCGPYDPVRIDVPDPSLIPNLRLVVEARWADVEIWAKDKIDDQTLSDRTSRSTYQAAPLPSVP